MLVILAIGQRIRNVNCRVDADVFGMFIFTASKNGMTVDRWKWGLCVSWLAAFLLLFDQSVSLWKICRCKGREDRLLVELVIDGASRSPAR